MRLFGRIGVAAAVAACAVAVLGAAFGSGVVLAHTEGVPAIGASLLAGVVGAGAWRLVRAGRRLIGPRVSGMVATFTGAFSGTIALSIALASTTREWRFNARAIPHAGRMWIGFALVGAGLLVAGLPVARERFGELVHRARERDGQAPIRARRGQRDEVYRVR